MKYIHSSTHQQSTVCTPREPRERLFAAYLWATGQAHSCKVQVLFTFHTDWLPSESVSAWCDMERWGAHMCKRWFLSQQEASRPPFSCLFIQDAFVRVFSSSNKYISAGQISRSRCAPPPKLQNGYHKPAPATAGGAETIEYFCNKPYILSGSQRISCSSHGSWSSRQPKCVRGSAWVASEGWGWWNVDSDSRAFTLKFTCSCLRLQPVDSPECQNS